MSEGAITMTTLEAFKRGDEVLSKFPVGSLMMVLAVEGLKVRCADALSNGGRRHIYFEPRYAEPRSEKI
jgi:hypothetical protein